MVEIIIKFVTETISKLIYRFFNKINLEDKKLGQLFLKEFPSNGSSCYFVKNHDLHNDFHERFLNELENFVFNWNNAEYMFINKGLEKLRKKLLKTAEEFTNNLSGVIVRHKMGGGFFTTKLQAPIDKVPQKVKNKEEKNIQKLNNTASEIYNLHQKLTLKIRKLLNQ